jgi:hypothetical protein
MSVTYCDIITFSSMRQCLGKHISAETYTHATVKELLEAVSLSVSFLFVGAETV